MAKVSVIIPVYKVEKYLDKCVENILKQTFSDFELILVDDGSPDNCPKMCDDFALKDKRVKVIHIPNGGVSRARNVGIEYALTSDSEWITFVDSDDYVDENYLQLLYNACVDTGTKISICAYTSETGSINLSEIKTTKEDVEDFWSSIDSARFSIHGPWAKLFKKELLKDIRFPVGKRYEDRFFMRKVWFLVKEIAKVDAPLYFYYLREDSFMHQEWSMEFLNCIEAVEEEIEQFTREKRYKCLDRSLMEYIGFLCSATAHLKHIKNQHKLYIKYRNIFRQQLKANGKKYDITWKNKSEYFVVAYPVLYPFHVIKHFRYYIKRVTKAIIFKKA